MKHRTGYLFKRGDNFYVNWKVNGKLFSKALRDDNGQPITTKRAAEDARDKFMAPLLAGDEAEVLQAITTRLEGRKAELAKWDEEQNPALPIAQAWTQFVTSPNRPDSGGETLYQYECQWSAFVDWLKEQHPELSTLRDVSKEIAEEYAGSLNHGRLSPNTYNKYLNLLTLVFRVVKDKARLTENVWQDIQRKRLVTHSRRELTLDELQKVCRSATGELKTLLALGVYTGLRLGDCATLRWAEVDLGQKMIRRIPNKTARRNPRPVIVPIHPTLLAMVVETPPEARGEYVLPEYAALYENRIDLVTDRIQAHFRACGLKTHKKGTGQPGKEQAAPGAEAKPAKRAVLEVGFHSLRHTFVSLCRESNAPLAVVESIVGHSNPSMTRHYTHVGELAAGKAVAALPAIIGEIIGEQPKQEKPADLAKVKALLLEMSESNWQEQRNALLAELASA